MLLNLEVLLSGDISIKVYHKKLRVIEPGVSGNEHFSYCWLFPGKFNLFPPLGCYEIPKNCLMWFYYYNIL